MRHPFTRNKSNDNLDAAYYVVILSLVICTRCVFRTVLKIYDGAFFGKEITDFSHNYFDKALSETFDRVLKMNPLSPAVSLEVSPITFIVAQNWKTVARDPSHTGQQIITMHIMSNISRKKWNKTTKFGQLIEYNTRNIVIKTLYRK